MEKDLTTQEEQKTCSSCGRLLPLSDFYKSARTKDGHENYCKECRKKRNAINYKKRVTLPPPTVPNSIDQELLDCIGPEHVGKPIQRRTPLSAYTPRELMIELKRRGFTGHLDWIPPTPKPKRVNLSDIE